MKGSVPTGVHNLAFGFDGGQKRDGWQGRDAKADNDDVAVGVSSGDEVGGKQEIAFLLAKGLRCEAGRC
jgi:hypothetical protein